MYIILYGDVYRFKGWLQYCSFDSAVNSRDVVGVRGGVIRQMLCIHLSRLVNRINFQIVITSLERHFQAQENSVEWYWGIMEF